MKTFRIFIALSLLIVIAAFQTPVKSEIQSALDEVNRIRTIAGLDSVILSKKLSLGCSKHAKYLVLNHNNPFVKGLNAHKEYESLQGASPEGKIAAKNSVINYLLPSKSVGGWESTFYHRIPLLQPKLKSVGIGYFKNDKTWPVSLIDCTSDLTGMDTTQIVEYPAANQVNVPTTMGSEIPHPLGKQGEYGFPITVYFANWQKVSSVKFQLKENDREVLCNLSTPKNPATSFAQWNSICAIPKTPLKANTNYTVEYQCSVNGKHVSSKYSFKTAKKQ